MSFNLEDRNKAQKALRCCGNAAPLMLLIDP